MTTYTDKYGRWHHRPCVNGEPSSNNGWIYTAYARELGEDVDQSKLEYCYNLCLRRKYPLEIDRSPEDRYPPLSHDEVIGLSYLGLLDPRLLELSNWNFCNLWLEDRKLTIGRFLKAIKSLWAIRKEHRNYVWENEVTDAYYLAFYLAPHNQYYVLRRHGQPTSLLQSLWFHADILVGKFKGSKSTKAMLSLKLHDLNHPAKFIFPKSYIRNYFDKGHPLNEVQRDN